MKQYGILFLACAAAFMAVPSQAKNLKWVDGADLTLINKTIETPRRYARVDTTRYDGFTDYQRRELVQHSAGLALAFRTDSRTINVRPVFELHKPTVNQTAINTEGFDLYIKKDGQWLWAGNDVASRRTGIGKLVADMDSGEKECIIYLPNFSIVDTVYVGVDSAAHIEAMPNPFRRKVVFHGSSFTHGTCAPRPGMSYPSQLERATGIQICNMGMSGNAKLQQSYARVLADTEADAFVFDTFSNPSAKEIDENFDAFVAAIRAKHPTTPLIFMQTIYRENRNFNKRIDAFEADKMKMAEKKVRAAMAKDPNIYWIEPTTGRGHETSVDGVHPGGEGYTAWMESIRRPLVQILGL